MSGSSGSGLLTFLVLSVLVILLAYASLRWVGNWQVRQTRGRRLRVLEGVPIGRDRHLLLVAVGKEVLVLGSSSQGVNLVHKLPDEEGAALLAEEPAPEPVADSIIPPALEDSINKSLGRIRSLLKKDSNDSSWGQP